MADESRPREGEPEPAPEPPKMVKVRASKWHTAFGEEHNAGDSYEIDEQYVASFQANGYAYPVDPTNIPRGPEPPKPGGPAGPETPAQLEAARRQAEKEAREKK